MEQTVPVGDQQVTGLATSLSWGVTGSEQCLRKIYLQRMEDRWEQGEAGGKETSREATVVIQARNDEGSLPSRDGAGEMDVGNTGKEEPLDVACRG